MMQGLRRLGATTLLLTLSLNIVRNTAALLIAHLVSEYREEHGCISAGTQEAACADNNLYGAKYICRSRSEVI